MPVTPTYPGVYVEEIPSGVRTIVGVSTSIGAFVDYFPQGPMNQAVEIFSYADFERQFGGLDTNSEASYAIQQFFLNGGTQAYVVRTTSATAGNGATTAAIVLQDGSARMGFSWPAQSVPDNGATICASTSTLVRPIRPRFSTLTDKCFGTVRGSCSWTKTLLCLPHFLRLYPRISAQVRSIEV